MYIGHELQVSKSGYRIIDDISSSFNGSTTSFALTVGGSAPVPFPINTQQIYISVNGVLQEPDPTGSAGFKLLGTNIVFSSAPSSGHAFFGVILAGADYVTVGTEFPAGSATSPSITFGTDNNTGLYSVTSGTMGFTADGVQTFTLDGNGFNCPDNKALNIGTGIDLIIKSDGSTSLLQSQDLRLKNKAGNENYITCSADNEVTLFFNNTARFSTTNTGTNTVGVHVDDGATHDGDVTFTGAAANVVWDKSADDLIFYDNASAVFGTGSDLSIFHDGTDSTIDNNTGALYIKSNTSTQLLVNNTENAIVAHGNGGVELYHDNTKKFETTSVGINILGTATCNSTVNVLGELNLSGTPQDKYFDASITDGTTDYWMNFRAVRGDDASEHTVQIRYQNDGGVELNHNGNKKFETTTDGIQVTGKIFSSSHIDLADDVKLLLGTGDDLQIYHNGTNSFIENSTGNLYIRDTSGGDIRIQGKSGEESIICHDDGAVELYYDDDRKVRTVSSGAQIESATGDTYLTIKAEEDDGGSDAFIRLQTQNTSATSGIQFGDSGDADIGQILYEHSDNSMRFRTNTAEQWRITSDGHLENNSDSNILKLGASDDLQIYHDGTHSYIYNDTGELKLRAATFKVVNEANSEIQIQAVENGAVELYYDHSKKFETTSTGITVTGSGRFLSGSGDSSIAIGRTGAANDAVMIKYDEGGDKLHFYGWGGSEGEILTLDNGNSCVGIGTSSPGGWNANAKQLVVNNPSGNSGITIGTGSGTAIGRIAFGDPGDDNIGEVKYNHSDNSLQFVANAAERLRITSNGHLLLGTSTDYADANSDDLQIYGTADTGMSITSGTSDYGSIYFGDGTSGDDRNKGIVRYNHSDDAMQFWTDAAERLRIKDSGEIWIPSDNQQLRFGAGTDFSLYHDGTLNHITSNNNAKLKVSVQEFELFDYTGSTKRGSWSGDGIKFGTDTSSDNALDDYEQGSWTAGASSYDGTVTTNESRYVKVGNLVHVQAYISFSNTTDSSEVYITGLPFTANGGSNVYSQIKTQTNANIEDPILRSQGGTTELRGCYYNGSDGDAKFTYTMVKQKWLIFGGTYLAA